MGIQNYKQLFHKFKKTGLNHLTKIENFKKIGKFSQIFLKLQKQQKFLWFKLKKEKKIDFIMFKKNLTHIFKDKIEINPIFRNSIQPNSPFKKTVKTNLANKLNFKLKQFLKNFKGQLIHRLIRSVRIKFRITGFLLRQRKIQKHVKKTFRKLLKKSKSLILKKKKSF